MSDSTSVRVSAPGKVNIALRVGAPRPDGFHPLDTILRRWMFVTTWWQHLRPIFR